MNFYSSIYFLAVIPSLILLIGTSSKLYKKAFSGLISILIIPLYLLGMYRTSGVDIDNYKRFYNSDSNDIFDPGFSFLVNLANSISLSFEVFLLFLGFINIFLYKRISKHFSVHFGILLIILILHIFIVRDFAQFRVGLAIATVIYGYTKPGIIKYLFYIIGLSFHITSIVLVLTFVYFDFFLKNNPSHVKLIIPFSIIILSGVFIGYLAAIDPRIDLYLNWDREGYGAPATDFKQPLFIIFIICIHLYFQRKTIYEIDLFTFCYFSALLIFISFSDYAIFSYRLSNVAISLYPITIASIMNSSRPTLNKAFVIFVFIILISLRENSFEIINSIESGTLQ